MRVSIGFECASRVDTQARAVAPTAETLRALAVLLLDEAQVAGTVIEASPFSWPGKPFISRDRA
jgi:hypothetical protein